MSLPEEKYRSLIYGKMVLEEIQNWTNNRKDIKVLKESVYRVLRHFPFLFLWRDDLKNSVELRTLYSVQRFFRVVLLLRTQKRLAENRERIKRIGKKLLDKYPSEEFLKGMFKDMGL